MKVSIPLDPPPPTLDAPLPHIPGSPPPHTLGSPWALPHTPVISHLAANDLFKMVYLIFRIIKTYMFFNGKLIADTFLEGGIFTVLSVFALIQFGQSQHPVMKSDMHYQ